ncbi:MAG: cell division protein Fic [Anaerolineaceae bacterium]|nr:MAG: cell division protein Fic [Anaerolineaceae bacterium]
MFKPKYEITHALLENIKRITSLTQALNQRRFPHAVLMELQKDAEAVSSFASTSIEGNPLPLTDVKRILKNAPQNIRDSEREVLNYNKAMREINDKLGRGAIPVTLSLILQIHKQVTNKLLPASQSGKLRIDPVFVNDPRSGTTIYWPPDASDVPALVKELILFVENNITKIDPLILAGLFHKQMVIIHPFMDGNGRTTRLLTKILLANMGLNTFNLFSFENYYNQNVTRYFQTVGVRGNYYEISNAVDFSSWLEYFTGGIIDELLRVEKILPRSSKSPHDELKPYHHKILNFMKDKGYITDKDYAGLANRARPTRRLDFNKLIEMGLIKREGKGKNTYYKLK